MSDLRDRLERLGERATPTDGAFERLELRRRRRERNRRLGAGALALLLVVGGSVAAFSAFRDADAPTVGGGQDGGFFALWPEQTLDELARAQERVDSGDPEFAWRADPLEVARRFATERLLWPAVDAVPAEGSNLDGDDIMFLELAVKADASCDQIVSEVSCPAPTSVTMQRVGTDDGLWSITKVAGKDLALPLIPGEEVAVGTTIVVPTNLADGVAVSLGVALLSACEARGDEVFGRALGGLLEFTVPDVPDGCVGYVYAIRPPTREGAVAIGSFLFTDAADTPAIGYLVEEITAIPVRFVNESPTDVAEFTCDETGTIAPSRRSVQAQPDGVHVAITNTGDLLASFSVGELGGDGVQPGDGKETVWQLPPGESTISCSVESPDVGGVATSASLTIVDPNAYFVPAELSCTSVVGQIPEYGEGTTGFAGDPVQVVRAHVSGLEFDDTVQLALYPDSEQPVVRVVRDGEVVARATLREDGQGGWLLDALEHCDGMLFGWSEEITGVTGPPGETGSVFLTLCEPVVNLGEEPDVWDGADLQVDGQNIDFDTNCLSSPAGEPLTISFTNLDEAVPRNISVYAMTPCLADILAGGILHQCPSETFELPIFRGAVITGVSDVVYELGPLEAGTYYFQDDVHPGANGVWFIR
jgi:hypothetical protein